MPIVIQKPKVVPEIRYDHVHITAFHLELEESDDPKYRVYVEIIFYAVVSGQKKFDQTSRRKVEISDLEKTAREMAQKGDLGLVQIMTDFESMAARYLDITVEDYGDVAVQSPV